MIFVDIDRQELESLASELFLKSSGIYKTGRKYQRMRETAIKTYEDIKGALKLKAAYCYFNECELTGKELIVNNEAIECNAFEQIRQDTVKGVYIYALSVEGSNLSLGSVIEQLYADLWGSAFADAARTLMKQELERTSILSESFGPGFFGMKLAEIEIFSSLLDMDSIGIEIKNGCIMLPLKSCAGLYFDVTDVYKKLDGACASCLGNQTNCKLCNVYRGL